MLYDLFEVSPFRLFVYFSFCLLRPLLNFLGSRRSLFMSYRICVPATGDGSARYFLAVVGLCPFVWLRVVFAASCFLSMIASPVLFWLFCRNDWSRCNLFVSLFPILTCPCVDFILVYLFSYDSMLFELFDFSFFSRVWVLFPCVHGYRVFSVSYFLMDFPPPFSYFLVSSKARWFSVFCFRVLLVAPFPRLRLRRRLLNVFRIPSTVSCACFHWSCCSSLGFPGCGAYAFMRVVGVCACSMRNVIFAMRCCTRRMWVRRCSMDSCRIATPPTGSLGLALSAFVVMIRYPLSI